MKQLILATFMVALTSPPVLACDDHHGACEIEDWIWHQTASFLTIEGVATCNEGRATIRMYDGEKFIGIVDGLIEGHGLQAIHLNIPAKPNNLVIKYSIDPG